MEMEEFAMERKFEMIDGVKCLVITCPKCGNVMKFKPNKPKIRRHVGCGKCGTKFEVEY